MALKLLVCFYVLQILFLNLVDAQYTKFHPEVEAILRNLTSNNMGLDNCDQTTCNITPCPGASPPRPCPRDVPQNCHFGCACHTDCGRSSVTCFQTKDCLLQFGRFFTARRRSKMST